MAVGIDDLHVSVAPHPGAGHEHVLQGCQRGFGAIFLEKAEGFCPTVAGDNRPLWVRVSIPRIEKLTFGTACQ